MNNGGTHAFISGLVVALIGLGLISANGQIPTLEERILNSSLNPSNNTWKADNLRIWPMPAETKGVVGCYRYDFELSATPRQGAFKLRFLITNHRRRYGHANYL